MELSKSVLGCIHLGALPGSPGYAGAMAPLIERALAECEIYHRHGIDGVIIENLGDKPFLPEGLGPETVAAMSVIGREVRRQFSFPIGINALRNDAKAALAVACAVEAQFIRVNIHLYAYVCDQGVIMGKAHETLRLRKQLGSDIKIWADVRSKHATPLSTLDLAAETADLCERGMADALIVSGSATGRPVALADVEQVKAASTVPIVIGSGVSTENWPALYPLADGFIVGSYFKKGGIAANPVDAARVAAFMKSAKTPA